MMAKLSKKARFIAMLTVTFLFFVAEILTGYLTNSMSLVADSFHMLSDVLSIFIGYLAVHYSDKKSDRNTYDWARAGVLGAMANAVFLMALVFTIILNAIQRLIIVEPITKPLVILGVGVAGLVVNIFGLFLFGGHAHGHDHHGHQHDHSHDEHRQPDAKIADDKENGEHVSTLSQHNTRADASNLNMQAVFLHVLGDALGSVVVIISALVLYFVEDDWRYYVDPVMSLVTSGIISWCTIPLLRRTAMILLQNPPTNVDVEKVREKVAQVTGVISIHDLHVWQLSGDCAIATVHIVLRHDCRFTAVAQELKKIFHEVDVHSTTIQPEFIGASGEHVSALTATSCTYLSSPSQDIDLGFSPCSDLGVHEETDSDTKCLLQCPSQDCVSKMCCDGAKKKSIVSNKQRKSAKSYDNPGYSQADNNNRDIAISGVRDINHEECTGDERI